MKITVIEGDDLAYVIALLSDRPYRLRLTQLENGRAKIKVDEGMWTPVLGEDDGEFGAMA